MYSGPTKPGSTHLTPQSEFTYSRSCGYKHLEKLEVGKKTKPKGKKVPHLSYLSMREEIALSFLGGCFNPKFVSFGGSLDYFSHMSVQTMSSPGVSPVCISASQVHHSPGGFLLSSGPTLPSCYPDPPVESCLPLSSPTQFGSSKPACEPIPCDAQKR